MALTVEEQIAREAKIVEGVLRLIAADARSHRLEYADVCLVMESIVAGTALMMERLGAPPMEITVRALCERLPEKAAEVREREAEKAGGMN